MPQSQLESLREKMKIYAKRSGDETLHAAGWLRDNSTLQRSLAPAPLGPRTQVSRAWHTSFTGLYRICFQQQDVWYPGGTAAAAASQLGARDRQEPCGGRRPAPNAALSRNAGLTT